MTDLGCSIDGPLTEANLAPLRDATYLVIRTQLTRAEWARLGDRYRSSKRPRIDVFIETLGALTFLEHFEDVSELRIECRALGSFEGIEHLAPTLRRLQIGAAASKALSLRPIASLHALRYLWLDGPRKDIDAIASLADLETLELRGFTLASIDALAALPRLHTLALWGGGTVNLEGLERAPLLRSFTLSRNRAIEDLSVLTRLTGLESLFLDMLTNVRVLPPFSAMRGLRRVRLDTMKGVADLAPLATAPALDDLRLIGMQHLTAASLKPFVGHRTLARVLFGLGSGAEREAAHAMFPGLAIAYD